MQARIYSPAKTAMQSGKGKTGRWLLEFDRTAAKSVEPLMGYTSSGETRSQVKLFFESKDEAVSYAQKYGLPFRVVEPKGAKRRRVAYADNFSFGRRQPWTH